MISLSLTFIIAGIAMVTGLSIVILRSPEVEFDAGDYVDY
jgi:hypothetical protein